MVRLATLCSAALLLASLACVDDKAVKSLASSFQTGGPRPDEYPVMLNKELPFRYPPSLYAQKVQGNVTLRLFVDRNGHVVPDSTRVEQSSGYPQLDSAAVKGSEELQFIPAKLDGEPIAVSIMLPVYFRHPDAPPLPGDTILHQPHGASTP